MILQEKNAFLKEASVYNLKHFPGRVRPALPARCWALAFEIGLTSKDSTLIRGLYTFCFENPGSITYTIPSIVKDLYKLHYVKIQCYVSAMLVLTTTFLPGGLPFVATGAGSKMRCCRGGGKVLYKGSTFISPASLPNLAASVAILRHASSISSSPTRLSNESARTETSKKK